MGDILKTIEAPLPPFLRRLHVLSTQDLECGVRVYTLYEVEEGKEGEGLREIAPIRAQFNSIEGYRQRLEPLADAAAAQRG